jgi:hypothetical protein
VSANKQVVRELEALLKDAQDGRLHGFVAVGVEVPAGSEGETEVSAIRFVTAGDVDTSIDLVIAGVEVALHK